MGDVVAHAHNTTLPRPIASLGRSEQKKIVRCAAGYRHSLVSNAKGEVRSFGEGLFGQLGLPASLNSNQTPLAVETPRQVLFPGDEEKMAKGKPTLFIKEIAVGDGTSYALDGRGYVHEHL